MSDSNTVAAVANGGSPQPSSEVAKPTDLNAVQSEVEGSIDDLEAAAEGSPDAAIDAAQQAGELTKQQANQLKKQLKLKVDGKEELFDVDFNNDEELTKHFQKSKAFDKRLQEFASYKSQVDHMLQMLQNDPEALLEKMGIDVDGLSEKRLSKRVEEMKKTPEQIEREKMSKELEDLRKEKKKAEELRQQAELERMRNEQAQQIETDITSALEDVKSVLPRKNPAVMQRIAQTMLFAMQNGFPTVTAKDVIPVVEKQWKQELNDLFAVVPEDVIEQLVGKGNIDRYRKKRLATRPKAQTATAKQLAQDTGTKNKVEEKPKEKKRMRDFFSNRE